VVSRACIPHLKRSANPHILTLSPPVSLEPRWLGPHIGLHHRQVRDDLVRPGVRRRVRRRRHRLQRAMAADADRHRRGAEPARRRRGDGARAQARTVRRRGLRGHQQAEPGLHREGVPLRGRASQRRCHRLRPVRLPAGRRAATRPVRRPRLTSANAYANARACRTGLPAAAELLGAVSSPQCPASQLA